MSRILNREQAQALYSLFITAPNSMAGIRWGLKTPSGHVLAKLKENGCVAVACKDEDEDDREELYRGVHEFAHAYGVTPTAAVPAPAMSEPPIKLLTLKEADVIHRAMCAFQPFGFKVNAQKYGPLGVTVHEYEDGSITIEGPSRKPGPYPMRETYASRTDFVLAYFGHTKE